MSKYEHRLADLGVLLPEAPVPVANYTPYMVIGNTVYVSGQISANADGVIVGKLGDTVSTPEGAVAARACAIALLSQVRAACGGDLDRLEQVVKLTGFVNSVPDYDEQPTVVNGASDLMVEALGDAGRHTRSAVGVASLPFGAAVEIEGIFRIA